MSAAIEVVTEMAKRSISAFPPGKHTTDDESLSSRKCALPSTRCKLFCRIPSWCCSEEGAIMASGDAVGSTFRLYGHVTSGNTSCPTYPLLDISTAKGSLRRRRITIDVPSGITMRNSVDTTADQGGSCTHFDWAG